MQHQRQLNIELLRIFSMLLITLEHVGFLRITGQNQSISDTFISYMTIFIFFHVDLFILITGYFGVRHTMRPLIKNILLLYFYSISLNIFTLVMNGSYSIMETLLPITHSNWWFMRMYILMLMIAPIIEFYVKDCSCKGINMMLIGALFVNLYLSHFWHIKHIYDEGFGIVNFVSIYIIGIWLRKVGVPLMAKWKYPRIVLLLVIMATMATQYKCQPYFSSMALTEYCGVYSTFMAIIIFLLFIQTSVSECCRKVVMFFSSSAIAVYLITEQPAIREMLRSLFRAWYQPHQNNVMGIVIILLSVVIAYITCCIIDKVRIPVTDYLAKKIINISFLKGL